MPWIYVAVFLAGSLSGFVGGWKTQDWRFTAQIATIKGEHDKEQREAADRAQLAEATYRQLEKDARLAADREREKYRETVRTTDARLAAALVELRKRPARNPAALSSSAVPGETPTCAGVSGAELAGGDAEFLERYAADVVKLAAALKQCEAYNAN